MNNQRLFFLEDSPKDRTHNNSGPRVSGRATSGQRFCQTLSADDLEGGESLIPIVSLTLSLTGVGPFGTSLTSMEFALKVLKIRYRQKLGIPQAGS